jgi:hypothetical protein
MFEALLRPILYSDCHRWAHARLAMQSQQEPPWKRSLTTPKKKTRVTQVKSANFEPNSAPPNHGRFITRCEIERSMLEEDSTGRQKEAVSLFQPVPLPKKLGIWEIGKALRLQRLLRQVGSSISSDAKAELIHIRKRLWSEPHREGQLLYLQLEPVNPSVFTCNSQVTEEASNGILISDFERNVPWSKVQWRSWPMYEKVSAQGNKKWYFCKHFSPGMLSNACKRCGCRKDAHSGEVWVDASQLSFLVSDQMTASKHGLVDTGSIIGVEIHDSTSSTGSRTIEAVVVNNDVSKACVDVQYFEGIKASWSTEFGQNVQGTLSSVNRSSDTVEVQPDADQTVWHASSKIENGSWSCVCGPGARVAIMPGDGVTQPISVLKHVCGTVVDLVEDGALYAVRLDNSDTIVHVDLEPENVLPEALPHYGRGDKLMVLSPSGKQLEDATVSCCISSCRYRLQLKGGAELTMDLNRFNHVHRRLPPQMVLKSPVSHIEHSMMDSHSFISAREQYRQELLRTRKFV